MTRREVVRVRDVAQVVGGATPKTAEPTFWGGAIPWLTPKDLSDRPSRYTTQGTRFLTDRGLSSSSARLLPPGSVLLTSRAPIGLVTIANAPIATNQGFKSLVLDETQCPEYWYYLLASSGDYLRSVANGSTFLEISGKVVGDLEFEVPPLDQQRRIAEVLGAIDDLIDTNARSIDKLAETFDAHSSATAFSTAEVIELGSKISLQKGVSYKGAFLAESGLPLVNLASFSRVGSIAEQGTKYYTGLVPPRKLLRQGDLVVANTDLTQERLLLGRPTIVLHESASSTHHTFQVAVEDPIDRLWVYSLLRHEPRREHLASFATGTTVTALPADALTGLEVPWPDRDRLERWHQVAAPLLEAARALEIENSELRRTRDELLPLLMSGAVRVRPEGVAA